MNKLFTVVLVFAAIAVALSYVRVVEHIATGFTAKILCSGVFVANRSPKSLFDAELTNGGGLGPLLCSIDIDYERKEVTATFISRLSSRTAKYLSPSLGCQLQWPNTEALVVTDNSADVDNEERVWPHGGRVELPSEVSTVDIARVRAAVDREFDVENDPLEAHSPLRTRAIVIVKGNDIIYERYGENATESTPFTGWSVTKSITSALFGVRVQQGKATLDDPIYAPEWKEADSRKALTVLNFLQMNSGLGFKEKYGIYGDPTRMLFASEDAAHYAASKAAEFGPNQHWSYSSGSTNMVMRHLRSTFASDKEYLAFPRTALFLPLSMNSGALELDGSGTFVGSSFSYATARDWAKFGLLYLKDGVNANGERILPEGWVKLTATPAPNSGGLYGLHWWLRPPDENAQGKFEWTKVLPKDAFWGAGYEDQVVMVIPSKDAVVVRLGQTMDETRWNKARFFQDILGAL